MNYSYIIFFIIIIAFIYFSKKTQVKKSKEINIKDSFKSKYILTGNEYKFYKVLKKITDQHNLIICPKVGLKDLFEVTNKSNYMAAFSKISQKHIDFLICDNDLHPCAAIELDDSSHKGREENDNFKNELFKYSSIELIRIKAYPDYSEKYVKDSLSQFLNTI